MYLWKQRNKKIKSNYGNKKKKISTNETRKINMYNWKQENKKVQMTLEK